MPSGPTILQTMLDLSCSKPTKGFQNFAPHLLQPKVISVETIGRVSSGISRLLQYGIAKNIFLEALNTTLVTYSFF